MDERQYEVIYKPKAKEAIFDIFLYIQRKGYPQNAKKFAESLYDFGNSLADFPDAYPVCKQKQLAIKQMRCAVFHKNYIFVYKVIKNILVIYNIIHCKTNPYIHSV